MAKLALRLVAAAAVVLALLPTAPAAASHDDSDAGLVYPEPAIDNIYPMVFPVVGAYHHGVDWHAPRGGGARVHLGNDIIADKMTPVVAVADGTVGWISGTCCLLSINHEDGWRSNYIHLNNDTPGTDDGAGYGIAPGITTGTRVRAGQLIGWVGDSGNAEASVSHLHFELEAPGLGHVDPYPSLLAAIHLDAVGDLAETGDGLCPYRGACDAVTFVDGVSQFHHRDRLGNMLEPARRFFYGRPDDMPLMGDWDCDGIRTPAMYRPGNGFMYLRNSNDFGVADVDYFYGLASDVPLAGDWNGDGCDTLAIYRPSESKVYVKNSLGTGFADLEYFFGDPGDSPFVGDFDGDGVDTVGLYRRSTGFVYFRNSHTTGPGELSFFYGAPGDVILAGDWDGNGDDTVAVYRPADAKLYVNFRNEQRPADLALYVGDYRYALVSTAGSPLPPPVAMTLTPTTEDIAGTIAAAPPDSAFTFEPGVYENLAIVPKHGDTFIGGDGVVFSGKSAVAGAWAEAGGVWSTEEAARTSPDGEARWAPRQVRVDGDILDRAFTLDLLGAGEWYYDEGSDRLYLGSDPAGSLIEASYAPFAFDSDEENVTIRDIAISGYAASNEDADVIKAGPGWTLDGVEVFDSYATGVSVATGVTITDSSFHHLNTGIEGWETSDIVIEGTEVSDNVYHGIDLRHATDVTIRTSHIHHNGRDGIIARGTDLTITGNLITDSDKSGIEVIEGDGGVLIADNALERNAIGWGYPIVAESDDLEIRDNTIGGGGSFDGLVIYMDAAGGVHHGVTVTGNTFVLSSGPFVGVISSAANVGLLADAGITFAANTYALPGDAAPFGWGVVPDYLTVAEWQGLGNDVDSTFLYD